MRIGIVGPAEIDSFGTNIGHSLEGMGHTVVYLGPPRPGSRFAAVDRVTGMVQQAFPKAEDHAQRKIAERAVDERLEIVIVTDASLVPQSVERMRNKRIRVALWFPDAVVNMGRSRMLTAPYSGLFFKDKLLVDRLKDTLDLPIWYLPQACNPTWHRPVGEAGKNKHIAVVGNTYLTRLLLLERLVKDGVPLRIYGSPIPRWAPTALSARFHTGMSVRREQKSQVFREAAGVLNNLHPGEMHGLNIRLFEATAAGGAVLCERRPALAELYDCEREVLPFTTYDELLSHIRALLADSGLTREIGDAAAKRAHADHAYESRLTVMLEKIA